MRIEGLRTLVWFWKPAICWRTQYILIDFRKRWSNPLYLIRKFLRLLGDLIKYNGVAHYCYGCLHRLKYEASLQTHIEYCKQHKAQRIYLPKKEENLLTLTVTQLQHPIPYVIYADFEAILKPIDIVAPSPINSYSEKKTQHIPWGYAYIMIGHDGKPIKSLKLYKGENVVIFFNSIIAENEILANKLTSVKSLQLTPSNKMN